MNGRLGRYIDTRRYNALLPQAEQELVQSSIEVLEKEIEKTEHALRSEDPGFGLPGLVRAQEH